MKALTAGFAFCMLAPLTARCQEVGRYQVIELRSSFFDEGQPTVLRVDTVTGEVWKLVKVSIPVPPEKQQGEMKTITAEGWVRIPDALAEDVKETQDVIDKLPRSEKRPAR